MINHILADYYEERGFIGKAKRLRRKNSLVIYGHYYQYGLVVLRKTYYEYGYLFGDGIIFYHFGGGHGYSSNCTVGGHNTNSYEYGAGIYYGYFR